MGHTRALAAALAMAAVLALIGCDGDGGADERAATPATPQSTASVDAEPGTVTVAMAVGCDRPEPERGSEALALVRLTDAEGLPVVGAMVEGEISGPGVTQTTAMDEATFGEALLFFAVTAPGTYTMSVTRVTLADGTTATFDRASALSATHEIGEVCVPPEFPAGDG